MTAMLQDDIRRHYEQAWAEADAAGDEARLAYSDPVEDAVLYPAYQRLLSDVNARVNGGSVLDVGCGSGRWVRYFLGRYRPARYTGVDFAAPSVELLTRRYATAEGGEGPAVSFAVADITRPGLDLGRRFDLVNVMNVLFHIPEPDKFATALANVAAHLASGGVAVTTEYLPRQTARTNWMLVRSRYDFAKAVAAAGLETAAVRASCFFANDPMGIDADDVATRDQFNAVRGHFRQVMSLPMNAEARAFFTKVLVDVDAAALAFCRSRMCEADLPAQKLVVLRRAA